MKCRPCNKNKRKHRKHKCDGEIVGVYCVIVCGCECNRPPKGWQPPEMLGVW